jgi:multidrug resistance efflux pump
MKPLETIPTPLVLRWREFRIKVFPLLIFGGVLVSTLVLWTNYVTPPTLVGMAETNSVTVASTKPGTLAELNVALFHSVHKGETLGKVITTDPKVIEASLAVIRAEVGLIQTGMLPLLQRERGELVLERTRLSWLEHKANVAMATVRRQYAEDEYQRVTALFRADTNIVSRLEYDIAVRDRDVARTEVEEETRVVSELEKFLRGFEALHPPVSTNSPADALRAAIAVQEQKFRLLDLELSPLALVSPADGVVSSVYRQSGENIVAGEPLLAINSGEPKRVIAYFRHPLPIEPKDGMQMEVRSRAPSRARVVGKVERVGASFVPIPAVLLGPLASQTPQLGLPVTVTIPSGLKLRHGEPVDVAPLSWRN